MAQETVTRKELIEMRIGSTRIFELNNPTKLQSASTTCSQLKNERKGEWICRRDYKSCSVSITRTK